MNEERNHKCQACEYAATNRAALLQHERKQHNISRRSQTKVGDELVFGPEPTAPVLIDIFNGNAKRRIVVHLIKMPDIIDLIAGVIRQHLSKLGVK